MGDIVQRLRNFAVWNNRHSYYEPVPLCGEAADEIERMREALHEIAGQTKRSGPAADEALDCIKSIIDAALVPGPVGNAGNGS